MRVVVLGATGNIGTAVVERLAADDAVTEVVGVARRRPLTPGAASPAGPRSRVSWRCADVRRADWTALLANADSVVVLAWMFHPTRRPDVTWSTNVAALDRLLAALPHTGVRHLVAASSVAAYSPHPSPEPVDESWPTNGASSAAYAREKAYVERLLDRAEGTVPAIARVRPAFVFQRRSSSEQRRIFAGPLLPQRLVRPGLVPVLPVPKSLRLQAVHAGDVADGVVRILRTGAEGPFNLCADDVLWPEGLAGLFDARPLRVPTGAVRAVLSAAWRTRAAPVPPELFDALVRLPVMSNARARQELGWQPTRSAFEVLQEFLAGLAAGAGHGTAPLAPA